MTVLSNIIVYIWLLPVLAQVLLPLAMLVTWLIGSPIYRLLAKPTGDAASIDMLSGATKKIV